MNGTIPIMRVKGMNPLLPNCVVHKWFRLFGQFTQVKPDFFGQCPSFQGMRVSQIRGPLLVGIHKQMARKPTILGWPNLRNTGILA